MKTSPALVSSALEMIVLPGGTRTTRLGFGCAYLLPETASLIDIAYESGVRHFDVAPAYGRGLTEGVLGAALADKAEPVTVTTKFGIEPAFANPNFARRMRFVRPLIARAPLLRSMVASRIASRAGRAPLTAAAAKASLERSLRALQRDRIDIFLLHEATADELHGSDLLPFLRTCVDRGVIGGFGVGGLRANTFALAARYPEFAEVLQHEWAPPVVPEVKGPEADLSILYRTTQPARRLRELFAEGKLDAKAWSYHVGCDLTRPGALEPLLLRLALAMRPDSLILFSSTDATHIRANVTAASDPDVLAASLRLQGRLAETREFFE